MSTYLKAVIFTFFIIELLAIVVGVLVWGTLASMHASLAALTIAEGIAAVGVLWVAVILFRSSVRAERQNEAEQPQG